MKNNTCYSFMQLHRQCKVLRISFHHFPRYHPEEDTGTILHLYRQVLQNSFARKNLIDPFINSDYELSGEYRQICFVSDEYAQNIKANKITTSVEWIGLWRHSEIVDFSKPIWCCSASLYEWHKKASPDNAYICFNTVSRRVHGA